MCERERGRNLREYVPRVRMRSTLSTSHHCKRVLLILSTSSGTTEVAITEAPPSLSDMEFTTEIALGPL